MLVTKGELTTGLASYCFQRFLDEAPMGGGGHFLIKAGLTNKGHTINKLKSKFLSSYIKKVEEER